MAFFAWTLMLGCIFTALYQLKVEHALAAILFALAAIGWGFATLGYKED